jgi:large subunit ribosomal protein L39e
MLFLKFSMCSLGVFLIAPYFIPYPLPKVLHIYSWTKGKALYTHIQTAIFGTCQDSVFFGDWPINKKQKLGGSPSNEKDGKIWEVNSIIWDVRVGKGWKCWKLRTYQWENRDMIKTLILLQALHPTLGSQRWCYKPAIHLEFLCNLGRRWTPHANVTYLSRHMEKPLSYSFLFSGDECRQCKFVILQLSQRTFRIKIKLAKKMKQNRPIPHWIRMPTDNTIRWSSHPYLQ